MRLVGYDRAPARLPRSSGAPAPSPQALRRSRPRPAGRAGPGRDRELGLRAARLAGAAGRAALAEGVVVKNPISADYEVMRTSLLPALVDAARRNVARGVAGRRAVRGRPGRLARAPTPRSRRTSRRYAAAILVGRRAGLAEAGRRPSISSTASGSPSSCLRGLGVASPRSCPCATALLHPGVGRRDSPSTAATRRSGRSARSTRGIARALGLEQRARLLRGRCSTRCRRDAAADPQRAAAALSRRSRATSRSGSTPAVTADEQRALLIAGGRAPAARPGRAGGLPRSEVHARRARRGCSGR